MDEYKAEPLTKYPAELYSTIRLKDKYKKGDVLGFWDKPWLYMPYPQQFDIMQIIVSYTDNESDQSFFNACCHLNTSTRISMIIQEYPVQHIVVFDNLALRANEAGMYTLENHLHKNIRINTQDHAYVQMEFTEDIVFPEGAEISMSLIGDIYASAKPKQKVVNNTSYPV